MKTAMLKVTERNSIHPLHEDTTTTARERDEWWQKQLRKERARQAVWEESLATVVKEGERLEQELRVRSRKRGSRVFAPSMVLSMATVKRRLSARTLPLLEEEP